MANNDSDKKTKPLYLFVIEHPGGLTSTIKADLQDPSSEKIEIATFFGDFYAYLESIPDNPEFYEDYVCTSEPCPIPGLTVEQVMDPTSVFNELAIRHAKDVVSNFCKHLESEKSKALPDDFFEYFKSYHEIHYLTRLSFQTDMVDEPMKDQSVSVHSQFAVKYSKPVEFSLNMYENIDDINCWYVYTCPTLTDVIFASFDYLLRKDYKMRRCDHCGKLFATKTLKSKYCQRFSPTKKYHHLKCEPAVRNARQDLERKHKYIYKRLETAVDPPMSMDQFLAESDEHRKTIRKLSSTLNLSFYQKFLEDLQKSIKESNAANKTKKR